MQAKRKDKEMEKERGKENYLGQSTIAKVERERKMEMESLCESRIKEMKRQCNREPSDERGDKTKEETKEEIPAVEE